MFFIAEARQTTRTTIGLGVFVQLAIFGIMLHAEYPTWRIGALGGLYLAFALVHRFIMKGTLDSQRVANAFIMVAVAAMLLVVGSAALTGGVHSVFIPGTVLPAIVSLLFFGPQAVARWVALGNALLLIAMVSLPAELVGPQLPTTHYTIGILVSLTWFLFMLHLLVGKLTVVASRAGESVACLREERLTVVASEISRMETILNEYLSFSRPLEDIKPETIDLNALARDVLDVLDGRAVGSNVSLALEGSAPAVQGDPRRLKEALINIVANALEATPSGGRVVLRVRGTGERVQLDVQDSGRGISPEDLERLGTSFFTTRPNGTGLGVVLAQGVITQHGGSLTYNSAVGKGTTATILLPLQAAPRPESVPQPEPAARAAMLEARA